MFFVRRAPLAGQLVRLAQIFVAIPVGEVRSYRGVFEGVLENATEDAVLRGGVTAAIDLLQVDGHTAERFRCLAAALTPFFEPRGKLPRRLVAAVEIVARRGILF